MARKAKGGKNAEINQKLIKPGGGVQNDPEAQDKTKSGAKTKGLQL
jgi:hypothetical protein